MRKIGHSLPKEVVRAKSFTWYESLYRPHKKNKKASSALPGSFTSCLSHPFPWNKAEIGVKVGSLIFWQLKVLFRHARDYYHHHESLVLGMSYCYHIVIQLHLEWRLFGVSWAWGYSLHYRFVSEWVRLSPNLSFFCSEAAFLLEVTYSAFPAPRSLRQPWLQHSG